MTIYSNEWESIVNRNPSKDTLPHREQTCWACGGELEKWLFGKKCRKCGKCQ